MHRTSVSRSLLAALAALLVCAPAAAAQERVCQRQPAPKPEPTKAERELANLKEYARQRAEFGFRHDLAYVRKLVKAGVWEYDVGYIPVTPRENRYLKQRDELDLGAAGYRYLRAHRDVDGGLSIEDDWPREAYILARFTKDVSAHLAALKRVAKQPDNVRGKRVPYSERELDRVRNRVSADDEALEAAGFHLQGSSYDTDQGVAEIELVTKRTDAKAYFAKRYGKRVKVIVTGTETTVLECAPAGAYAIAPDGMSLTVSFEAGGGTVFERAEVLETADRVEVGMVRRGSTGARTLDLRSGSGTVPLSAPLGDRAVFDVSTGKRMLQRGPSPGDPPCPVVAEPTELEQAVERRIEQGLPADPAYVQRRLNSRSYYTRAEQRWLAEREALDSDDGKVSTYLRAHTQEYGGTEIVGTFPARPYRVYRFTGNLPRHAAAIQRRSKHPEHVRVEAAVFTEQALEALAERIRKEADAGFLDGYGRAGFYVRNIYTEIQAVVVRVITTRSDHAAWFTARYGPSVRTEVIGDRFECAAALE